MILKYLMFFTLIQNNFAKYVGDKCRPSNEVEAGLCMLITSCKIALSSLENKGFHTLSRCGFQDLTEIVCCPRITDKFGETPTTMRSVSTTDNSRNAPDRPASGLRIADRECKKIVENTIPPLDLHIIGGETAVLGEFPHMVGVGFERGLGLEFDCGGTLISERFVLTAAHCVDTKDRIAPSVVRAGVMDIGGTAFTPESDVRIATIYAHPNYTAAEKYHDLALLKLEKAVELSPTLNAACLYTSPNDPTTPLAITGWGQTSNIKDARSKILLKANVSVVENSLCSPHYQPSLWRKLPRGIVPAQLCAGDSEGRTDTCQGDSGGPLQSLNERDGQYRIVGVTSFGRSCGSKIPGVYTRVYNYLDWIESQVWSGGR